MPEPRLRDNHSTPTSQVPGKAQRSVFGLRGVPVEYHEGAIDVVDSLANQSVYGRQRLSTGILSRLVRTVRARAQAQEARAGHRERDRGAAAADVSCRRPERDQLRQVQGEHRVHGHHARGHLPRCRDRGREQLRHVPGPVRGPWLSTVRRRHDPVLPDVPAAGGHRVQVQDGATGRVRQR